MKTRPVLLVIVLLGAGAAAGCGGPTKAGREARQAARDRLDHLDADITNDQAMQAFMSGRFDKAATEVNHAIALNPKSASYRVLQGRIFLETHRLEKALECFEKAIELQPTLAEGHYYAGVVHQRWGEDSQAYESYLAAYNNKTDNVAYFLAAAESLVALEQFDEARQLIDDKLAYFEHNAAMHQLLGEIAMLQDAAPKAVTEFEEAQRLDPDNKVVRDQLVQAQYAAGLYGDCYRAVRNIMEDEGARTDLKRLEARCLVHMDRPDAARNVYVGLAHDEPDNVDVWLELGTLAWDLGDYARLSTVGARLSSIAPDRFEGYMFQGVSERHQGNTEEAVAYLREAAQRTDASVMPHLLLGRVLDQAGNAAEAAAEYAAAVKIDPANADAQSLYSDSQDRLLTAQTEPAGDR